MADEKVFVNGKEEKPKKKLRLGEEKRKTVNELLKEAPKLQGKKA